MKTDNQHMRSVALTKLTEAYAALEMMLRSEKYPPLRYAAQSCMESIDSAMHDLEKISPHNTKTTKTKTQHAN